MKNLPDGVALVFKNDKFAIVSPEAACYSELAGHLDGSEASWCISTAGYQQYWRQYRVGFVFYIYAFEEDASWCMVLDNATVV